MTLLPLLGYFSDKGSNPMVRLLKSQVTLDIKIMVTKYYKLRVNWYNPMVRFLKSQVTLYIKIMVTKLRLTWYNPMIRFFKSSVTLYIEIIVTTYYKLRVTWSNPMERFLKSQVTLYIEIMVTKYYKLYVTWSNPMVRFLKSQVTLQIEIMYQNIISWGWISFLAGAGIKKKFFSSSNIHTNSHNNQMSWLGASIKYLTNVVTNGYVAWVGTKRIHSGRT